MRLRFATVLAVLGLAASPLGAARAARQTPDPASILALARAGKADDAWRAWKTLPGGAETLRLGVEVASALRQVDRGVDLYTQLVAAAGAPDPTALRAVALAATASVLASNDPEAKVTACGAVLRLDATNAPCRDMLQTMASRGRTTGEQAIGAYTLADAGLRPFPGLFTTLEQTLTANARIQFASRYTHLPAAERLSLVRPLLAGQDTALQYQAVLTVGEIRSPEALAALRNVQPTTSPVRMARLVALAEQGDDASLEQIGKTLDSLDNYLKIPAGLALARAGDARGSAALDALTRSPVDLQRVMAAAAIAHLNPAAAREPVLDALEHGSPALRPAALGAAATAHLGLDPAVYRWLPGPEPIVSAGAIAAVAETLAAAAPPAASRLP